MALRESPDLGDETIAVVFFLDIGLQRCQQMFADLNRYAIRPSRSIGVLYDHRDEPAEHARLVDLSSPLFRDVVEMERSTLSTRSRKLFTLSAIYNATSALVSGLDADHDFEAKRELASSSGRKSRNTSLSGIWCANGRLVRARFGRSTSIRMGSFCRRSAKRAAL